MNFLAVCEENPKSIRYHPGLWFGRRWSCCKSGTKIGLGCQLTSDWGDQNNNPTSSEWRKFIIHRVGAAIKSAPKRLSLNFPRTWRRCFCSNLRFVVSSDRMAGLINQITDATKAEEEEEEPFSLESHARSFRCRANAFHSNLQMLWRKCLQKTQLNDCFQPTAAWEDN